MKTPSRKFSRFLVPAVFLLSVPLAIGLIMTKPQAKTAAAREVARTVNTVTVKLDSLAPTVPVFVKVSTPNHASLRAAITADVFKLLALEGQLVKADQELVILDDREASLAVEQRKADVQEAQSQIDAEIVQHENELYVILNDKGKRAEHNREQIVKRHKIRLSGFKAKKLRADSALRLAQLDLQRTRLKAPFTGQVTAVHVSTGDRVRPGDKIIDLYDKTSMELSGTIPRRYIPILQSALRQDAELAGYGVLNDQEITARLDRLGGAVSQNTGGIDAFFNILSDQSSLQLGRSLKLQLELPPVAGVFVVPDTALYGTSILYKIVEQRLKSVTVQRLGDYATDDGIAHSLIRSSEIANGDIILSTQLPNAVENLLVKIVE
jgi:RND family efflux transporter MFP subunit